MPVRTEITKVIITYANGTRREISTDNPLNSFTIEQSKALVTITQVTKERNYTQSGNSSYSTYTVPKLLISTNNLQDIEMVYTEVTRPTSS